VTLSTPEVLPGPWQQVPPRSAPGHLDPSLKAIFDDLSEGVLMLDLAGQRVYANPALNDLVGTNACLPLRTPEAPPYVPADQRDRYLQALKGTSSLLALDGPGTATTWLELATPAFGRVRAKVSISSFGGPHGWRFAVWLLNADQNGAVERAQLAQQVPGQNLGSLYLPAPAPQGAVQGLEGLPALLAIGSLTRREKEVLQLLLEGRRVSSIARCLFLSPQTVRNHLKSIFHKVGAHSQAELLDILRPAPARARPTGPPGSGAYQALPRLG